MKEKPILLNRYFFRIDADINKCNIFKVDYPAQIMGDIIKEYFNCSQVDAITYNNSYYMNKMGDGEILTLNFLTEKESYEMFT